MSYRKRMSLPVSASSLSRVLADELAPRVATGASTSFIVGIDGRSGSGKSAFAAALREWLQEQDVSVAVLELEQFYRGWHGLAEGLRHVAGQILNPVRRGHVGHGITWDWHRMVLGPPVSFPEPGTPWPDMVIVEGCGAGSEHVGPYLDHSVWLHADEQVRRTRVEVRDGRTGPWWQQWANQEAALLARRDTPSMVAQVINTTKSDP